MKLQLRTKDSYKKLIYDFTHQFIVVCPSCGAQALVKPNNQSLNKSIYFENTLSCTTCGYSKHSDMKSVISFSPTLENIEKGWIVIGAAVDPYFHQPLWLQSNCCSNTLWAYNYEHLDFLETHVSAKLRERNTSINANRSIGSRLPRWLTSQKNREAILKEISQMKARK